MIKVLQWLGIVFFVLCVILAIGSGVSQIVEKKHALEANPGMLYRTIRIDGCQYIESRSSTYMGYEVISICHKGNCNNRIHKQE